MLSCPKCGVRYYGAGCPQCDFPQTRAADVSPRMRLFMGLFALLVSIGCSLPGFLRHGPAGQRALVFVFAGVFALAGLQILLNSKGRVAWFIGAAIVAGLSTLAFVAAFGPGKISGGAPFLPPELNQKIGRFAFGAAGVAMGAVALFSLWRAIKPASRSDL